MTRRSRKNKPAEAGPAEVSETPESPSPPEAHPLDAFADLAGKVPAAKIAEMADTSVETVEDWLEDLGVPRFGPPAPEPEAKAAEPAAPPEPLAAAKPEPAPTPGPKPAGRIACIQVLRTTAISVKSARGRRVRITVPRSLYRGELARKYAGLLDEADFRVVSREG